MFDELQAKIYHLHGIRPPPVETVCETDDAQAGPVPGTRGRNPEAGPRPPGVRVMGGGAGSVLSQPPPPNLRVVGGWGGAPDLRIRVKG